MRDYDPWIFGMLWDREHREELRRLTVARQVRRAVPVRPSGPSAPGGQPASSGLSRVIAWYPGGIWPRHRRPSREVSGGT